jgi:hypothetical protein
MQAIIVDLVVANAKQVAQSGTAEPVFSVPRGLGRSEAKGGTVNRLLDHILAMLSSRP